MADKLLTLNQQLALLPAAIPDAIVDFLEDFNYGSSLQTETARAAFDPEYLTTSGDTVRAELDALRGEMGKFQELAVEQGGREIPGAFMIKLTFEKGARGVGLITKLKERTILKVMILPGPFDDAALKALVKNPPR